ncbi:hypothetical protein jhhlp_005502 [Lomentospora prolificans]|uniref:Uncharacterized protein n=1 Tax=Lomentospora prolificans TaxID=41688 RepID=A0A2N3N3A9_9PEZI|nr:hypothetical protein jhhlp_005502 [Lomentospora prolificans]
MKELLDSDRVNFLVWRFVKPSFTLTHPHSHHSTGLANPPLHLHSRHYRETAAKFQKEWHIKEPHRHFDFAPHVQSHALVSVINRGLLYNSLEREYAQRQVPQEAAVAAEASQFGVFGPLVVQPTRKIEDDDSEDAEEDGPLDERDRQSRKRQIDPRLQHHAGQWNGSPTKKPRLSNGYENRMVVDSATTPMDSVDPSGPGDNHAYPSPLEGEPAPTPIARTDGPDQGTQVDKVQELAPETTFLRLTASDSVTGQINGAGENAPILLHCEWNPKDPSRLAAAGTDALARVWTISRATAGALPNGDSNAPGHVSIVNQPFHSLVEEETPPNINVTALAWNWDGTAIAVATDHLNKARINIWGPDGSHLQRFEVAEPPIIKLRWSPSAAALLAVSVDNGGTLVTVYPSATSTTLSYFLGGHDLGSWPLDAAWINETDFLLCGGDILQALRCTENSIVLLKSFETKPDDNFTQILFDWRSKLAATSSDKGVLDLWDETGQRRSISAHSGAITAMQWQPLQTNPPEDERLIASGGDDCAILISNARLPDSKPKCFLTMDSPIVALSFTPDGAFIAGATSSKVLIWKVGDHAIPRASWSRTPHPGWFSPKVNAESDEEDEHCLCWDATGTKLAYGANSRLAVIDFR